MEQAIKHYASEGTLIPLGRVGEKKNIQVYFDIENLIKEGGTEGTCWLYLSHNTWTYPTATLEVVDNKWAVWTPAKELFSFSGRGRCELSYEVGADYVGKSPTYHYVVLSSLSEETGEEPPTPVAGWIEEIRDAASDLNESIEGIEEIVDQADEIRDDIALKVEAAENAKSGAEAVQDVVAEAQKATEEANTAAQSAKTNAEKSADAASSSEANASSSANKALASEQNAESSKIAAATSEANSKTYAGVAQQSAEAAISAKAIAESAQDVASTAAKDAEAAAILAQQYSGNPPKPINGTWWVWNPEKQEYEDTGVRSILSITKTYPSIEAMNKDFANVPIGDLVLINTGVDVEDNAKLYIRNEDSWQYLSDLSGVQGTGISSIIRTTGDGSPGSKDTYTITLTDNRSFTFDVYNGTNGTGAGDMLSTSYDPQGEVAKEGGVPEYVSKNATKVTFKSWTLEDLAKN